MFGNGGSDQLCDWEGKDILNGGMGRDRFVLTAGEDADQITDFTKGEDLLVLPGGLTFAQLSITENANTAFIRIAQNGQLLAALNGVPASAIDDLNDFTIFG